MQELNAPSKFCLVVRLFLRLKERCSVADQTMFLKTFYVVCTV